MAYEAAFTKDFECTTDKNCLPNLVGNLYFTTLFRHIAAKFARTEEQMSTFKEYAKRAKERMKNGFWEQAKQSIQTERQVAATLGLNTAKVSEEQKRKLQRQIYDYDGFCEEQEFYAKVEAILDSEELVSNPIMRLADKEYLAKLSPADKQTYISKLAAKYREAVERYNRLRS